MNMAMLLTFRLIGFGWTGNGCYSPLRARAQSSLRSGPSLSPLPLVVTNPAPIIIGLTLLAVADAFIYRSIPLGWLVGVVPRAWRMELLLLVMTFLFWEFFTPLNLFGAPLSLMLLKG